MAGFSAEERKAAAVLEPANHGLILQPGHDHFAIKLSGVFFVPGKSDRSAVGHDRRHRVSRNLYTAIIALGSLPLPPRLSEHRDRFAGQRDCFIVDAHRARRVTG